jgi:predicted ester cyclase
VEEQNKELIRQYTRAVFDEGDVEAVDRYLAPDFFNHVTGRTGREDFRRLAAGLRDAPGSANVIDLLVAEGEFVVALMTITRTVPEAGRLLGFAVPAGGRYTVKHVHVYRVVAGRIREHWALRDDLGMLRQLGAVDP